MKVRIEFLHAVDKRSPCRGPQQLTCRDRHVRRFGAVHSPRVARLRAIHLQEQIQILHLHARVDRRVGQAEQLARARVDDLEVHPHALVRGQLLESRLVKLVGADPQAVVHVKLRDTHIARRVVAHFQQAAEVGRRVGVRVLDLVKVQQLHIIGNRDRGQVAARVDLMIQVNGGVDLAHGFALGGQEPAFRENVALLVQHQVHQPGQHDDDDARMDNRGADALAQARVGEVLVSAFVPAGELFGQHGLDVIRAGGDLHTGAALTGPRYVALRAAKVRLLPDGEAHHCHVPRGHDELDKEQGQQAKEPPRIEDARLRQRNGLVTQGIIRRVEHGAVNGHGADTGQQEDAELQGLEAEPHPVRRTVNPDDQRSWRVILEGGGGLNSQATGALWGGGVRPPRAGSIAPVGARSGS